MKNVTNYEIKDINNCWNALHKFNMQLGGQSGKINLTAIDKAFERIGIKNATHIPLFKLKMMLEEKERELSK